LQGEVQHFHWNNAQTTVHPFALYFRGPLSVVSAVHIFQR